MINTKHLLEYKKLIQTTNLQKGYQEQTKLFRLLRIYLEKELKGYTFSGNIVENNMDYAYFQFTNEDLKSKGLKIVLAFIYKDFEYEVWLSGYNRKVQNCYQKVFKEVECKYDLTNNPNRTDYILKNRITNDLDYNNIDKLQLEIKVGVEEFIESVNELLISNNQVIN